MSDHSSAIDVRAPADAVFRFVSDVQNLPKYLPTVHGARPQGGGRVQVDGAAHGHEYHSDGWFKVDPAAKTVRWGSDGENDYGGEMRVSGTGEAARVEVRVHDAPKPDVKQAMDRRQGGEDRAMQDGLDAALRSIKHILEGTGSKQGSKQGGEQESGAGR